LSGWQAWKKTREGDDLGLSEDVDDLNYGRSRYKLQPKAIRTNLLKCAALISTWELLSYEVLMAPYAVIGPKSSEEDDAGYSKALIEGRFVMTRRYREEVLRGKRDAYRAAAKWLVKRGAISASVYVELLALRKYRHRVAHKLAAFIVDHSEDIDHSKFERCTVLLDQIARWSFKVQAGDPSFDGEPMITLIPKLFDEVITDASQ
jgi:hypothetical protein